MRHGDFIQTFTGRQFWPLDPRADEVEIEDIAHALSMICRFNGHTRQFYSVAEHSVFVAMNVPVQHRVAALLHDASEAYICDLPRPIKHNVTGYAEAEAKVMAAIAERFKFDLPLPECVKLADNRILLNERDLFMAPTDHDWDLDCEPLPGCNLRGWMPPMAEQAFLETWYSLGEKMRVA